MLAGRIGDQERFGGGLEDHSAVWLPGQKARQFGGGELALGHNVPVGTANTDLGFPGPEIDRKMLHDGWSPRWFAPQ
jgi:hypothetical protein